MGNKIFVSYKHKDQNVFPLRNDPVQEILNPTTARDYIDELETRIDSGNNIYKGERDDEDLSHLKDETIRCELRDKIYDSSITIVMISPNMKEAYTPEDDQWIPWEVSYSLKEHTRDGRTSQTNAVLAVVLPDKNNSYEYFIEDRVCLACKCRYLKTNCLFRILRLNMFNVKNPTYINCEKGDTVYKGYSSYIHSVKWRDFVGDINNYIDIALKINENIGNYNITKQIMDETGVFNG